MPDRHERIEMLYSLRRYTEAEALAREQIAETPESSSAYALLAMCITAGGPAKYDEAIDAANAALKHDPTSQMSHFIFGWVYRRKQNFDEAERFLREALRFNPFHDKSLAELAELEFERGRTNEARKLVLEGLNFFPTDADFLDLLIRLDLNDNRVQPAMKTILDARKLHPKESRFHYLTALVHEHDGLNRDVGEQSVSFRNSDKAIREALRNDPTNDVYQQCAKRIRNHLVRWRKVPFVPHPDEGNPRMLKWMFLSAGVIVAVLILFVGISIFRKDRPNSLPSPSSLKGMEPGDGTLQHDHPDEQRKMIEALEKLKQSRSNIKGDSELQEKMDKMWKIKKDKNGVQTIPPTSK